MGPSYRRIDLTSMEVRLLLSQPINRRKCPTVGRSSEIRATRSVHSHAGHFVFVVASVFFLSSFTFGVMFFFFSLRFLFSLAAQGRGSHFAVNEDQSTGSRHSPLSREAIGESLQACQVRLLGAAPEMFRTMVLTRVE